MKKLILFSVIAARLAFSGDKAMASLGANWTFSVSGTAVFEHTNYVVGTNEVFTTVTKVFNNKTIYNLISNAVANAGIGLAANLPANGYIVFNPGSDNTVYGYFYVTNKSGFYYQLSGFAPVTFGGHPLYYSFIELDSYDWGLGGSLGFGNSADQNYISRESYSSGTGNGLYNGTDVAELYIHSNPNDFDIIDNTSGYNNDGQNTLVIYGILKLDLTIKDNELIGHARLNDNEPSSGHGTITGTGNIVLDNGNNPGVITSATATLH